MHYQEVAKLKTFQRRISHKTKKLIVQKDKLAHTETAMSTTLFLPMTLLKVGELFSDFGLEQPFRSVAM